MKRSGPGRLRVGRSVADRIAAADDPGNWPAPRRPATPCGRRPSTASSCSAARPAATALDELAGGERPINVRRLAVMALAAADLEAAAAPGRGRCWRPSRRTPIRPTCSTLSSSARTGPRCWRRPLADKKLPADVAKVGVRTVRALGPRRAGSDRRADQGRQPDGDRDARSARRR